MKTLSLKCQNCGAVLDIDGNRKFFYCSFCGNKIYIEKEEIVHRIVDEAKLKELDNSLRIEEENRKITENKKKKAFKAKMVLLVIWTIIVLVLYLLSNSTQDIAGFSPYHLVFIPVLIFGVVIIIKEILKFFKNN